MEVQCFAQPCIIQKTDVFKQICNALEYDCCLVFKKIFDKIAYNSKNSAIFAVSKQLTLSNYEISNLCPCE